MSALFETRDLVVRYRPDGDAALGGITMTVERGSFSALIGPNGSGKSTLIRALLGAIAPHAGDVLFEGKLLPEWSRRELAKRIGVVTQLEEMPFPVTVRELVAMGRYPHLGAFSTESDADRAAIEHAMQRCDVAAFAGRLITELSGGERQRARIARALAQQPNVLVLDEPTVALDVAHEMSVFELLRSLTRDDGWTVLLATHHLNLAARYAHTLLLLDRGTVAERGTPAHVLNQAVLERVYNWPLLVYDLVGATQIAPLSRT